MGSSTIVHALGQVGFREGVLFFIGGCDFASRVGTQSNALAGRAGVGLVAGGLLLLVQIRRHFAVCRGEGGRGLCGSIFGGATFYTQLDSQDAGFELILVLFVREFVA